MKKAILIFCGVYALIGIIYFGFMREDTTAADRDGTTMEMTWDVENEAAGNYHPPLWLKDPKYRDTVEEIEYSKTRDSDVEFTSAFQITSLMAQAQLGDTTIMASFVNPDISYTDYPFRDEIGLEKATYTFAKRLTRDWTLKKVQVSSPTQVKENEVTHDIILQYKNGEETHLIGIPMVFIGPDDDHTDESAEEHADHIHEGMWYMNITLTQFAELAEKNEK
ncbi:hypothetical protein J2T17_007105 [Paenibacillus mucilaginosus]|uniref:hypothetical protein n=1 Tax=Paenibacillus mucilaginosus TaxID=61624 RepID=UPI003D202930